jgi:anti-anti-sigma factor
MASPFPIEVENGVAKITLKGRLDTISAPQMGDELKKLIGQNIKDIVFYAKDLEYISSAGLRVIVFAKQKIGINTNVFVIAPKPEVVDVIRMTGFQTFIKIQDNY